MRLLSTLAASALAASSMFSVAVAAPIVDQSGVRQATANFASVEEAQYPYPYPYAGGYPYPYAGGYWGGKSLLLVWERLARPRLVLVRLCVAPRLRLGRPLGLGLGPWLGPWLGWARRLWRTWWASPLSSHAPPREAPRAHDLECCSTADL